MKTIRCLVVAVIIFLIMFAGCITQPRMAGAPLSTDPMRLLRDTAVEGYADFAAIVAAVNTASMGDFANKPSTVIAIPSGTRVATLYVCGTTTNNDTLSIVPYGYVADNGPVEIICDAAGVLGTQDVVLYPDDGATATNAFWVDTWTITNDYWRTSSGAITNVNGATGANIVNTISFDPLNLRYLGCYVHGANGGASAGEADTVTVYVAFTRENN